MKGWKTLTFNLLTAILGVVMAFDWTGAVGAQYAGYIVMGVSIANMVLRTLTNTPVGQATPSAPPDVPK